jgi:hypothetical protein
VRLETERLLIRAPVTVPERLGLSPARDLLQNGSKTMRLYALERDGVPLRP